MIRIFPFYEGVHIEPPRREQWQTELTAEFLGKFHKISAKMVQFIPESLVEDRELELKWAMDFHARLAGDFSVKYPQMHQRISQFVQRTISEERFAEMEFLPTGLIHADFHELNVLFLEKEKKLSAVLDWDDCLKGPFLYDIAGGLLFWCCVGTTFSFDLAKVFIEVYQKFREFSLTDLEKKLLRNFMFFVGLSQFNFIEEQALDGKDVFHFVNPMLEPLEFLSEVSSEDFQRKCLV